MRGFKLLYLLIVTCMFLRCSAQSRRRLSDEKRLHEYLFSDYNPHVRPVEKAQDKVKIKFGLALLDIIDVDEKSNTITTHMWMRQLWMDFDLKWEPADYGNLTTIRLPSDHVWKPDIELYNAASEGVMQYQDTLAVLYSSGDVLLISPAVIKSRCQYDLTDFPFDTQHCVLKFGSWAYNGYEIDPDFYEGRKLIDLSDYVTNNEWTVIDTEARKYEKYYPCCAEPYPDLKFNLTITRKNSVFGVLSVTPFVLLAFLCPIIFLFPYVETQRFSLGGCILICLVLLLASYESVIPASSGHLPIIGQYYISILFLLSLSLIFSAVILNIAARKSGSSCPPKILKLILVDGLARICCVPKDKSDSFIDLDEHKDQDGGAARQGSANGEWSIMARALDRLFFLIYVLLTVIMTLAFLGRMHAVRNYANQDDVKARLMGGDN